MQTSPEKSFAKPIEHLQKSDKSEKEKLVALANEVRSERSNSVHSSGSRHHTIEQDIEAKLHEVQKPIPPVTKSIIEQYLEQQSSFFLEFTAIDFTRQFNYNEYLDWRHNTQKVNRFHDQLQKADVIIIEKYTLDNMAMSEQIPFDLNEKAYFDYRLSILPYFEYLQPYIFNCITNSMDCSYLGYEYYSNFMREKEIQAGNFRKQVMESSKVSYSQQIFDQFVMDPNCHFNLEAYAQYFQEMEQARKEEERQQLMMEHEKLKKLKEEIADLNLYIYDEFRLSCQENGVELSIQGYKDFEAQMRNRYDDGYLKEKHEELEGETEKRIKGPQEKKGIVTTIDREEMEFLKKNNVAVVSDGENVSDDGDVEEVEKVAQQLESRDCKCCGGKPESCEGQACGFLGQCICQTDY